VEDFELMATSHELFLEKYGFGQVEGAILPSEFLAGLVPLIQSRPNWIGFAALEGDSILGTGMYKHAPDGGMVEIGYGVAPSAEGRGVATSLVHALCDFGFSSGASVIRAHTLPDGFASQRVLSKNGFKLIGQFEDPDDGTVFRYEKVN
jgi:RimJ/RimL family protein N-acetyltransferase